MAISAPLSSDIQILTMLEVCVQHVFLVFRGLESRRSFCFLFYRFVVALGHHWCPQKHPQRSPRPAQQTPRGVPKGALWGGVPAQLPPRQAKTAKPCGRVVQNAALALFGQREKHTPTKMRKLCPSRFVSGLHPSPQCPNLSPSPSFVKSLPPTEILQGPSEDSPRDFTNRSPCVAKRAGTPKGPPQGSRKTSPRTPKDPPREPTRAHQTPPDPTRSLPDPVPDPTRPLADPTRPY